MNTAINSSDSLCKHPNLVLAIVAMGTLLGAMYGSMINLALPSLGREIGVSIESLRWVVQGFLLVLAVLLLPIGRLSDLVGHNRVYIAGCLIFAGTSVMCGASSSFSALVVGRILQGVGGAMMMATGPASLTTTFPPKKRGRVLGMLATSTYMGLTIGPPLGGFIIAAFGWRWLFFFSAPLSVIIAVAGFVCLPKKAASKGASFDWMGALLLFVGLPLLLLAMTEGRRWGFDSLETVFSMAAGSVLMVTFVLLQRKRTSPLLDLGLFNSRVFVGAILSAVFNYVALFVMIILMPFFLEEGLALSTASTGMVLSAQPIMMAVVASPAGWLSDKIGSRGLAVAGMAIMSVGLLLLSTLGPDTSILFVVGCLGIMGVGTGIFISPNSSALMGSAPRNQQGSAGSILAEARILGMLFGVGVATVLFKVAGGETGSTWEPGDFQAFGLALKVAAAVAVVGALSAAMRGGKAES